jgi:hypothetical protein
LSSIWTWKPKIKCKILTYCRLNIAFHHVHERWRMDTGARSPHILCENTYSDVDESDPAAVANRDELNHMQASLLRLHVQLLNYALERGYAYKRWLTVQNTILFKDPDNVRIHRTRVIHIYEADYNSMLCVKWRTSLPSGGPTWVKCWSIWISTKAECSRPSVHRGTPIRDIEGI